MGDNQPQPQPSAGPSQSGPGTAAGKRLGSWKEIAVHLNRDVRTVKRWEKSEGLPVHRQFHLRQASVYAFAEELEAWREKRRPALDAEQAGEPEREPRTQARRWVWLATAVTLAVAAAGLWLWLTRAPALPFAERDWVLISHFENRTGQPVFDGAVEYALERELSNSRFVNVVPRQRVRDALQLMRRPPDTPVDAQVGREVCLRDGGIRALITGRVEKFGTTYVLSTELVNPQTGVTVASFSQQAAGVQQVVPAVGQLADGVRKALGEDLASTEGARQKLARVTTPSLRALHLFTQADAVLAGSEEGNATAEQLLKEAISEDPEFASAYMHLAFALVNQGRPPAEYQPYARRALELSKTTSDRERYFITGSYYSMMGEDEKAVAAYRTLVQLYPDHFWGNNNLAFWLARLGRPQEAVPYWVKNAELRPHDFRTNWRAGQALALWANDPVAAHLYLERAHQLLSPDVRERFPLAASSLELFPFFENWKQGRVEAALAELNRVDQEVDSLSLPAEARGDYAWGVGEGYLTLGKLRAAEKVFGLIPDKDARAQGLAMVAWARGDRRAVSEDLRHPRRSFFGVMLLASAGFPKQAQEAMYPAKTLPPSLAVRALHQAALGELALARGQTAEAVRLLQEAFPDLQVGEIGPYFLLAADALAKVREEKGNRKGALEVLERTSQVRERITDTPFGAFWLQSEWHRARLLRALGREPEAAKVETELRQLLADADPDHPILQQLQRLQTARLAGPG